MCNFPNMFLIEYLNRPSVNGIEFTASDPDPLTNDIDAAQEVPDDIVRIPLNDNIFHNEVDAKEISKTHPDTLQNGGNFYYDPKVNQINTHFSSLAPKLSFKSSPIIYGEFLFYI